MLKITQLTKSFGGVKALTGLDLVVSQGEIVGLIGPNGSGKSTTVNLLSGLYRASGGQVHMGDRDITQAKPEHIARLGLARTFQNLRVFNSQSVLENIRIGQNVHCQSLLSLFNAIPDQAERQRQADAERLMARLMLDSRRLWTAETLSYGEKKRLEIARALAMRPKILLLDEPAAGMNAVEVDQLMQIIRGIAAEGVGVLLIEHHMKLVMNVCDRIAVLNFGAKIAEGLPVDIARNPLVIKSYLGETS